MIKKIKISERKKKSLFIVFLIVLLGIIVCYYISSIKSTYKIKKEKAKNELIQKLESDSINIQDSVYSFIFQLRLENPKIVMAQCIEESGNFKSKLFLEGNNLIGMKVPSKRPTLAKSVLYSHAKFDSWKECLIDYSIWQQIYARGLKEDEYFNYLDKVYAEKKGYSDRLKKIIEKYDL